MVTPGLTEGRGYGQARFNKGGDMVSTGKASLVKIYLKFRFFDQNVAL